MEYFNKLKIIDAFFIIFVSIFQKTGIILILEESYRKKKSDPISSEFSQIATVDFRSVLRASVSKRRIRSRFWLKNSKIQKNNKINDQKTRIKLIDKPPLSLKVKLITCFIIFNLFNCIHFIKIDKNFVKTTENVKKT